jgi:hypothetical protein
MTAMLDRLLDQLAARGLYVEPGDKPGQLKLSGRVREADDAVWRALKLFKPQLLARFGTAEPKAEVVPEPANVAPPAEEKAQESPPADDSTRAAVVAAILARAGAAKRRVYGFGSGRASCAEVVNGRVPAEFDRLCVEGDAEWVALPAPEPSGGGP